MRIQDLHILPKFRDCWSYLYVEHCIIEQQDKAIAIMDASGKVPVPCATLWPADAGAGHEHHSRRDNRSGRQRMPGGLVRRRRRAILCMGRERPETRDNLMQQARLWADTAHACRCLQAVSDAVSRAAG